MTPRASRRARPPALPRPPQAPQKVPRARLLAVAAAFALVYGTLEIASGRALSATWDEPIHLAAGYAALETGDYRVDLSHPPFMRLWAALPLLAMPGVAFSAPDPGGAPRLQWLVDDAYEYSRTFLYERNDADRLLLAARTMVVFWGVACGILLFLWAYEWLGFTPAIATLLLYGISPTIAAHSTLVTTDAGVTCFTLAAVYFLWRTMRRFTAWNVAGVAISLALAITTKFSGLALVPVCALLLLVAVRTEGSAVTWRRAALVAGVSAVTVFIAIWAVYGFRHAPGPSSDWMLRVQSIPELAPRLPPFAGATAWVDAHGLLPNGFAQGLLLSATTQVNAGFLAGRYSADGWWYYFPVAFLIKTPIALLALFAGGLVAFLRRRSRLGLVNESFVLIPLAAYLAFAMASGFNIGIRHILPIYPFVILIATAAVASLATVRAGRVAVAGLAVAGVVEFAGVYPYTLTFFNQLVGGPDNGYRYLTDSNLSWGQSLKALKRWLDEHGVDRINLAYFGQADPAYYGVHATYLPGGEFDDRLEKPALPGYVAISPTILSGVYATPALRLFYQPFRDLEPVAIVANSLRIYRVDRWPVSQDAGSPGTAEAGARVHRDLADWLLEDLDWPEQAIRYYRRALDRSPGDSAAGLRLGMALAELGRTAEALGALEKTARLAPASGQIQLVMGELRFSAGQLKRALAHAERAVELMPGAAAAYDLRGRLQATLLRFDDAIASFDQALRLSPGDGEIARHRSAVVSAGRSGSGRP